MGMFVNPTNSRFQVALNSEIYVDKTELLCYTNRVLDTNDALICNSRPRRFGKSITAHMLVAYYSKGCDSETMFHGLKISEASNFKEHLNKYNAIHLDVQWCRTSVKSAEATVPYMEERVMEELREIFPDVAWPTVKSLPDALATIHQVSGQKFMIIIDEWDCLIRDEAEKTAVQEEYIHLLRGLFKGSQPMDFLHLAYLTGILPIKKIKTQSALNNFEEFTMLSAKALAPYIGFTEQEVRCLCDKYNRDFDEVKLWYDGYRLSDNFHVYNPKAVISVMKWGEFESYWSMTGTYDSIVPLINMDFDGLRAEIIQMVSGDSVEVEISSYQNDMVSFENKDDVETVLIHLGYLAYDRAKGRAFIPNEEIRSEFMKATRRRKWNELIELQVKSAALLRATLDMDGEAVAAGIQEIHMDFASTIQYNSENSLSSVLNIAYLSAMQYYYKPMRELPTGRGFADFVFLPKAAYPDMPVLLVELKWNQSAKTAIQQIKKKQYTKSLESYKGDMLLVGINYNKKDSAHTCIIEPFRK